MGSFTCFYCDSTVLRDFPSLLKLELAAVVANPFGWFWKLCLSVDAPKTQPQEICCKQACVTISLPPSDGICLDVIVPLCVCFVLVADGDNNGVWLC